jgi:hypothetical protein
MCNDPMIRKPLSGCAAAYSSRTAINPGISCSASMISLRPQSANSKLATLNSSDLAAGLDEDLPAGFGEDFPVGLLNVCVMLFSWYNPPQPPHPQLLIVYATEAL